MSSAATTVRRTCFTCWQTYNVLAADLNVICPPCAAKTANAAVPKVGRFAAIDWGLLVKIAGGAVALTIAACLYFYVRGHTGIIGEIRDYADRMCDCPSAECRVRVNDEYNDWLASQQGTLVSLSENADIEEQDARVRSCAWR